MRKILGQYGLVAAIGLAAGLAWLAPDVGARGGPLQTEWLTRLGVFAIFFVQGLRLELGQVRLAVGNWQAHLAIQGMIFGLAPVGMLGIVAVLEMGMPVDPLTRAGLLFLAILPSTISSAVAFTAQADGDIPLAIFHTALSNLLAVLLVPTGVTLLIAGEMNSGLSIAAMLQRLAMLILLPLGIGLALQGKLGTRVERQARAVKLGTSAVIVLIAYAAFCDGFAADLWADRGSGAVAVGAIGALTLLVLMSTAAYFVGTAMKLPRAQRASVFFCGSQKSLATGAPIAVAIFGSVWPTSIGAILLPLMLYHAVQLVVASLVVGRWGTTQ